MGEPQAEVEVGWLCETGEAGGTEGERWSLCVCVGGWKYTGTSQSWSDRSPEVGETLSSKIAAIKD